MIPLRQSTASQIIQLGGVFVDSGDGDTEETGLTIANTDIKLHKNGATSLASKNSGGATHMANGRYYATFDATDTNTVGPLTITIHVSGALVETIHCYVFEEAVYDALYASGATGLLPANVTQISGDSTAADNAESFFDGTGYAGTNNVIPSVTTVTGNVNGSVGSVTGNVGGNVTGTVASVVGAVGSVTGNVGGSVASVVGAVGSVTGSVGSVTGAVGSVTGHVGGNVVGSTGSVLGGINTLGGTITTLDGLDTAQDTQHATTLSKMLKYFQLLFRKDAAIATDNATELTAVNSDGGSGSGAFDNTTESAEALKDLIPAAVWSVSGRALSDPAGFKKNTAADLHFAMIDAADHVTPIAGETVTAQRVIDGGTIGSCTNSVSEISNGLYKITLSADDLNGDVISLRFTSSGSDDRLITIKTET